MRTILIIVSIALVVSSAFGKDITTETREELVEPGFITVADPFQAPPVCFVDEKGAYKGYFVEIVRGFAKHIGVKPKFVSVDWPGVLPGVTSLRFDMGGCYGTLTAKRLASDAFIASTYFMGVGIRLMVLEDSSIREWDDTKGRKIGAIKGTAQLEAVLKEYPTIKLKEYSSQTELMLDVVNRRVEAGVLSESIIASIAKANPNLKLKPTGESFRPTTRGTFFAPTHIKLEKAFADYIEESRQSGELNDLAREYFGFEFDWEKLGTAYDSVKQEAESLKKK